MHHLPRIFASKKQSKHMDHTPSPRHKLLRRNAAKNFEFTPSASASSSTSPSERGSSAHRTRSLDLPMVDQTSFRIEGNDGEMDLIFQSLGLSGPDDLGIPKAAYETAMKSRSSSDVIRRPRKGHFDFNEPEEPKKQEVHKPADTSHRFENNVIANNKVTEAVCGNGEQKLPETVIPPMHGNGAGGKSRGIKGDRPPLLTPPPAMSLPVLDDGCSTWELLKGLAPEGDRTPRFTYHDMSTDDEEEGDGENVQREGHDGVRMGETIMLSGSCSFTTTNDDDSSSTTTEAVSIISPNGLCRVNITHWEKGALLGKGSFGTVYEGISSEGFFFAVKEVSLNDQGSQGKQSIYQLEQEIELLSQFEHENIVRYLGTDKDDSNLYIFLELVTQGSLASLYQKYHLRDSHVSAYTRQILQGLKYLHDRNVVHRDIKCANILVASNGTVKLADFGLAKATRLNDLKSFKGTGFWMAPEVVNHKNKGYGLAADIWSLGCTVLEMITGQLPYYPLEFMQALYRIGRGEPPPIPDTLSRDARDFIQQCLRVNPIDRPTAAELLEHPFLRRPLHTPLGSESPLLPSR